MPHTQTILSARRTKFPAPHLRILQSAGYFRFDLGNASACPPAPILFSEPRVGFDRGLEMVIYSGGSFNGSTAITHKNTIP
jgi:hypothetical protein